MTRNARDEARAGERDQSAPCTRSISTCPDKLYNPIFIYQSLSGTPTSLQHLTCHVDMFEVGVPERPHLITTVDFGASAQQPLHLLCCTSVSCFEQTCCVLLCNSVVQCVAVWCNVLQCVVVCCSVLQCVAVCCSVLQCVALCCSVLPEP